MPSRQPIAYYASLLQGLHVEPYQGAQVYQLALKEHCKKHGVLDRSVHPAIADFGNHDDGDIDGIICCTVGEEDGPHAPARTGGVHIVRPGPASDTGIGCEGRPAASSGAGGASAAASSGVGGAGEIDDGIIVAVAPAPKGLLRKRKRKRPEVLKYSALDGAEISYDEYINRTTGEPYDNYKIYCTGRGHIHDCHKTMGRTATNLERWGELGILAFLQCWLQCPDEEGKSHAQCNPDPVEVRQLLADRRDDLQHVFDTCRPGP